MYFSSVQLEALSCLGKTANQRGGEMLRIMIGAIALMGVLLVFRAAGTGTGEYGWIGCGLLVGAGLLESLKLDTEFSAPRRRTEYDPF